jgi:hypothetical protein
MDARPTEDDVVPAIGRSRRAALRTMRAGGLAATLLVRGRGHAVAQDVAPTPAYAAGMTAEILGGIEPPAAPGYVLELAHITFAPGAAVAARRPSGGAVTTQIAGSHAFTVREGAARLIRAGTATPAAGT